MRFGIRQITAIVAAALLAGCVVPVEGGYAPLPGTIPETVRPAPLPQSATFAQVVDRVAPMATAYCRQLRRVQNCNFRFIIDDRPGQPVNAAQTVDSTGRPILAFTLALIREARNPDELAFVIGHEAAHHAAGHIPQAQQSAMNGALLAGIIAASAGMTGADLEQAQQMGAVLAARSYSKEFELGADALGAEIAWAAGFDPLRGAAFFDRLPDPGDRFLGSHPPNSQRKAVVAQTVARLNAGN